MNRLAIILAAGAVLLSVQSAMADTCFVEELSPSLKTFSFTNVDKNFREVMHNRLIVLAGIQAGNGSMAKNAFWSHSGPSAIVTCFSDTDSAPTLLQRLEVYRDAGSNEFKVRETGL